MATSTEHFKQGHTLTYGEALDPAMIITDAHDAANYLSAYVEYTETLGFPHDEAVKIALGNIGYYALSCSSETYKRVQRLFGAVHPLVQS